MKVKNAILNLKRNDEFRKLSHKLLQAFNETYNKLEYQFLCLKCNGISVNPLNCKHCGHSYCDGCIRSTPESEVICLCKTSGKIFFEKQINNELFNTYYYMKEISENYRVYQIIYSKALYLLNDSRYVFIPSEDGGLTTNDISKYRKQCRSIYKEVSKHKEKILHHFSFKGARLINFNFVKGYKLILFRTKIFCEIEGRFLAIIHLACINLNWCHWTLDFSLSLSKAIILNKQRLNEIKLGSYLIFNNLKVYLIIFNAIQFCKKLNSIKFKYDVQNFSEFGLPISFYQCLSSPYFLQKINFEALVFHDGIILKPFQNLIALKSLKLIECRFHLNAFASFYLNNFPHLNQLYLIENKIKIPTHKKVLAFFKLFLKNTIKFPPIVVLRYFKDSFNSLEYLIFLILTKCQTIQPTYLELAFFERLSGRFNQPLFKFLLISKIQYLKLIDIEHFTFLDSNEF